MKDYPLLKKAVAAGVDAVNLGPLGNWSKVELESLVDECDEFYTEASLQLDSEWGKAAMEPANFLSKARSKSLDKARDDVDMSLLAKCSEMCAAALYWIGDKERL